MYFCSNNEISQARTRLLNDFLRKVCPGSQWKDLIFPGLHKKYAISERGKLVLLDKAFRQISFHKYHACEFTCHLPITKGDSYIYSRFNMQKLLCYVFLDLPSEIIVDPQYKVREYNNDFTSTNFDDLYLLWNARKLPTALSLREVDDIRRMYKNKVAKTKELVEDYEISRPTFYRIINYETYHFTSVRNADAIQEIVRSNKLEVSVT